MEVRKAFLELIFEAGSMRRWNDKICPVELRELDKQAHKMIIAYVIGKFEENNDDFSWMKVIEGGCFEFLQRLIVTDLKPQLFYEIKNNRKTYAQLNKWVYEQLRPKISPLGVEFCERFRTYFSDTGETLNKNILNAAHFYATRWEFDILERANPNGYEMQQIRGRLEQVLQKYYDLEGMRELTMYPDLKGFVDLCGQLRFQTRWSHINMTPRISVLGHMLIVAMLAYLLSLAINACQKRCINNYFTGLFHDLPEVLTRDIISPVKESVQGLQRIVKRFERKQMKEEVYKLIPSSWHGEIKMYTENEFKTIVSKEGEITQTTSAEINQRYNRDEFSPRDGQLVRAIDHLAAYIEAYLATEQHGIKSTQLEDAKRKYSRRYRGQKAKIAGIDFASVYADFGR
ncbi:MAG: HD domain-containing protein [Dehalococcoidia bacterium]|nr:HD domain-containing protein [Dehalococcoidia bacterium]